MTSITFVVQCFEEEEQGVVSLTSSQHSLKFDNYDEVGAFIRRCIGELDDVKNGVVVFERTSH
jgi:hypothetical protein